MAIFACGIIPIFFLLSESRRVATISLQEMQATSLATSMIDGLKAAPLPLLETILGQDLEDGRFPPALRPVSLGIPSAPSTLRRLTTVRVVNQPTLPVERFSNPWGRVFEIAVVVFPVSSSAGKASPAEAPGNKPVLRLTGYRQISVAP